MDTLLIAVLGSGVISAIVSGGFNLFSKYQERKWSKSDRLAQLENKMHKSEMDSVRLQMLVMMSDYPDEKQEIMRLAEHYFKDLKGNWYLTSMFNKWLLEHNEAKPEWFKSE